MEQIRLQKLFFVTVVAKVFTAALGWYLQMPWSLGFILPLVFMAVYIAVGLRRAQEDIGEEKFADTCYYLGFIFTITSIIFSLFDLPNIGTRIQDIAVRFGAAMVSTVFGLAVRVYLVSFRKDGTDAVHDAEDAVVEAVRRFTEQMRISAERLAQFDADVHQATAATVERSRLQLEKLTTDFAAKLESFFGDLASMNQVAFASSQDEVRLATERLAQSMDAYAAIVGANLQSIETKMTQFADAVTARLSRTTFPDDFFAQQLSGPVNALRDATQDVARGVQGISSEVTDSTAVLSAALRKLKAKAAAAEDSLDAVVGLADTQQLVLRAAEGQLDALGAAAASLNKFDDLLTRLTAEITSQSASAREVSVQLGGTLEEGKALRSEVAALLRSLESQSASLSAVGSELLVRLEKSASFSQAGALELSGAAASMMDAAGKLGTLQDLEVARSSEARTLTGKFESLLPQFAQISQQLERIATAAQVPPPAAPAPIPFITQAAPTEPQVPLVPTSVLTTTALPGSLTAPSTSQDQTAASAATSSPSENAYSRPQ